MKTLFHILRQNDKLNMQNDFIFFDTETKRIKTQKLIEEKFYLGWLLYWNKVTGEKDYLFLQNKKDFYAYVLDKMQTIDYLILYAHNTDFDIKVLGGINNFIKKGYVVDSFYINGMRFIIKLKKGKKIIEILDTMNYIPMKLKDIGSSIGLEKKDIDFNKCSDYELKVYCKNDVEIIFRFIQLLIEFLEKYELSKLKPTVSSLSMNIFRHRFYNKEKNPIYIHDWHKAVELERLSYRGGISDCFKIGENIKEHLYKLDINSMYPYIMKEHDMPIKLLYYSDIEQDKQKTINKMFHKYLNNKLIIARCKIFLPKEYSYILVKTKVNKQTKSIFLTGEFIVTLTTPEINFVKKYGKIIEIYNIAIYECSNIFGDFVDFFYNKRKEFDKKGNKAYKLFCKYILNSLYGKFGQTQLTYLISPSKTYGFDSKHTIDTINNESYIEMTFGNRTFECDNDGKNSFDSFVAISSFVTSYARIYLVEMILKAKRENTYYIDTDCLIVNQKGFDNLKPYINNDILGKLKLEEESNNTTIYRPKYYIFNNVEKCKGVKKSAKRINETSDKLIIEQEQFTKFKTSLRKDEFDKQMVSIMIKEISKTYDKGIILKNGDIESYEFKNSK